MDREDRPPIAYGWQIGRNHMKDSHAATLQESTSVIYPCSSAIWQRMNRVIRVSAIAYLHLCALLLRQQAAVSVVQQVSAAAIEQISAASTGDLACGRGGAGGARTVRVAGKLALPRPFDTFVNAIAGLYVPAAKFAAPGFTLEVSDARD
jgi:hypothetical protein